MATTSTVRRPDSAAGPRFLFDGVSWDDYQAMLRIVGDRPIRVSYDRGRMEVMSPLWEHGSIANLLGRMIDVLTEERNIPVEGANPVTFNRPDLEKGVEPDRCYYLGPNAARVRGKTRLEMGIDPPPDLIVEADITSSSLDRVAIFAALGIPEVWRFADDSIRFLHLQPDGSYRSEPTSHQIPGLVAVEVIRHLEASRGVDKTAWIKAFRAWVREALVP